VNVEVLTELAAVVGAAGDTSATRTVYGMVILLGAIGVALVVLAIWLIKQTKPEPQLLAPLERMDDRAWRKQEPAEMRRDLDSLRPAGARPVRREKDVPDVDAELALSWPTLENVDDLQAELAADVQRGEAGGADPLLAKTDAAVDTDDHSGHVDADENLSDDVRRDRTPSKGTPSVVESGEPGAAPDQHSEAQQGSDGPSSPDDAPASTATDRT
jgi:hypothetical protein